MFGNTYIQLANLLRLLFSDDDKLKCRVYYKGDDFICDIFNLSFMDINIPISTAYGVYGLHMVAFAWRCTDFQDYLKELLVSKLLEQKGFQL